MGRYCQECEQAAGNRQTVNQPGAGVRQSQVKQGAWMWRACVKPVQVKDGMAAQHFGRERGRHMRDSRCLRWMQPAAGKCEEV